MDHPGTHMLLVALCSSETAQRPAAWASALLASSGDQPPRRPPRVVAVGAAVVGMSTARKDGPDIGWLHAPAKFE